MTLHFTYSCSCYIQMFLFLQVFTVILYNVECNILIIVNAFFILPIQNILLLLLLFYFSTLSVTLLLFYFHIYASSTVFFYLGVFNSLWLDFMVNEACKYISDLFFFAKVRGWYTTK